MASARIYIVKDLQTNIETLVQANNQAQALRHVAKSTFVVSVASGMEVARHMKAGVKLQDATEEQEAAS